MKGLLLAKIVSYIGMVLGGFIIGIGSGITTKSQADANAKVLREKWDAEHAEQGVLASLKLPPDITHVWIRAPYSMTIDDLFYEDALDGAIPLPENLRHSQGKLQMKFGRPGANGQEEWHDIGEKTGGRGAFTMSLFDNDRAYYIGDGIYYLRHDVFKMIENRRPQRHAGCLVQVPMVDEEKRELKKPVDVLDYHHFIWDRVDKVWRHAETLGKVDAEFIKQHPHIALPVTGPESADCEIETIETMLERLRNEQLAARIARHKAKK